MAIEIAHAYLAISPSLKGSADKIKAELEGAFSQPIAPKGSPVPSSWSQQIQNLGTQIQGVGDKMSSLGSRLTRSITLPIAGATAAVGGLVAALGWKRLVSLDTAQAQMRGLGYATEDVERIMGMVDTAVDGTMLSMAEGAGIAASALAAGVAEGEDLERWIRLVGDSAAYTNSDVSEMANVMNTVQAQGKLTGDTLLQLSQRNIPLLSWLAEEYGVTADEMSEMVSRGEVDAETFSRVMSERMGGMSDEVAKSFSGMTANIRANVGRIGELLLQGVFEQSKDSLEEFLELLRSDEAREWAADMGVIIGNAFSRLVDTIKTAISWWMSLDTETKKFIGTIAGIVVAAGPVLVVLGKVTTVVGTLVTAFGKVVGWLGAVKGAFAGAAGTGGAGALLAKLSKFVKVGGPIGLAIGLLMDMWFSSEELREAFRRLGETIWESAQRVWDALMPVWEILAKWLTPAFEGAMEGADNLVIALADGLVWTIDNIVIPAIETLTGWIESASTWFQNWATDTEGGAGRITAAWEWIRTKTREVTDWYQTHVQPLLDAFWGNVSAGAQNMAPLVEAAWQYIQWGADNAVRFYETVIKPTWDAVWTEIQNIAGTAWGIIEKLFRDSLPILETLLAVGTALMEGDWDKFWKEMDRLGELGWGWIMDLFKGQQNFLGQLWDSFLELMKKWWGEFWDGVKSDAEQAWNDLVGRFQKGIDDAIAKVVEFKDRIINWFKDAFSWLQPGGKDITGGLLEGITSIWDNPVTRWFNGRASSVKGFFSGAGKWLEPAGGFTSGGFRSGMVSRWFSGAASVVSWLSGRKGNVTAYFSSAGSWLSSAGNIVSGGFRSGMVNRWFYGAASVVSWLSGRRASVKAYFSSAGSWLSSAGNIVSGGFRSGMVNRWLYGAASVVTWLSGRRASVKAYFSSAGSWLSSAGNIVSGGFRSGMVNRWLYGAASVVSWLGGRRSSVRAYFSSAGSWLSSAGGSVMKGLRSGMFDRWIYGAASVVSWLKGRKSSIQAYFAGAGSWLLNSGRALINGFRNGINERWAGVRSAVSVGLSKVRNLFPFSPAKEGPFSGRGYTEYSGQALIEDFGKGIAGSSPAAVRAMSEAAERIAAETDISAHLPDFMPADWSAASSQRVAQAPAPAVDRVAPYREPRGEAGGGDHFDVTIQMDMSRVRTVEELIEFADNVRRLSRQTVGAH